MLASKTYSVASEKRGTAREPRYALCECGAFLGPVAREDEESPMILGSLRNRPASETGPHAVRVLRRSELRDAVGDQSAADALDRRAEHYATLSHLRTL